MIRPMCVRNPVFLDGETYRLELVVDLPALLTELGARAVRSRKGECRALGGKIFVRVLKTNAKDKPERKEGQS